MNEENNQEAESTPKSTKTKVMGKFNELRSNVEKAISDVNVGEIKSKINTLVKEAQKDFNKLATRDLEDVKKKLQKEKEDIEAKAKKFLDKHQKEINTLQEKFEKLKAQGIELKNRATRKKVPAKKKVAKKARKKVAKKV